MTERTKALAVSGEARQALYARDSFGYPPYPCCVTCGNPGKHDPSHYIKRSQSGLGILENLINQCRKCHDRMENGDKDLLRQTREYLMSIYPDWDEENLRYKKDY